MADHTDSRSRSTRSRSRSMRPAHSSSEVSAVPHANGSANGKAGGEDVPASASAASAAAASVPRKQPAAVAVSAPSSNGHQHLSMAPMVVRESGNGGKNASPRPGDSEFFWCEGEPDVRKIAIHLDTLTGAEQQLRASQVSLTESYATLNATVGALLDSNQRLRKELRAQKLSSNRRWFWGAVALLAATLGQSFIRSMVVALLWAMERPGDAWPLLLEGVGSMSGALWLLACPLVLALFVHHLLHAYSHARLSLGRTVASMVVGLAMQAPLLYFVFRYGAAFLADVQSNPPFASPLANQAMTVGVWLLVALLDYTLIVMHYYIE